eukprot:1778477-Pyramimonas_sp.AAC.1
MVETGGIRKFRLVMMWEWMFPGFPPLFERTRKCNKQYCKWSLRVRTHQILLANKGEPFGLRCRLPDIVYIRFKHPAKTALNSGSLFVTFCTTDTCTRYAHSKHSLKPSTL